MYDACDSQEVSQSLGGSAGYRKRLDARRGNKPKKADNQRDVCTPFDHAAFNFSKISNQREILAVLPEYNILTNRFPLFPGHCLLTAKALVPQQLSATHLSAIVRLVSHSGFSAYFNSWCDLLPHTRGASRHTSERSPSRGATRPNRRAAPTAAPGFAQVRLRVR